MTIASLIFTLILLGVVFFFVEMIPMAAPYPKIIRVIAVILAVLLIAQFLGVINGIPHLSM
jgi:hypothetical protein